MLAEARASAACRSPLKPARTTSGFAPKRFPTAQRSTNARRRFASAENREALVERAGARADRHGDDRPLPLPAGDEAAREEGRWDQAWGGIASLGLALPVMWTAMTQRGVELERIGKWMAAAPAQLAGLAGRKGAIAAGADADLVVFDPDAAWTVTRAGSAFPAQALAVPGREAARARA